MQAEPLTPFLPEDQAPSLFLLARFAEFYEEVAGLKLAAGAGKLLEAIHVDGETPPAGDDALAARVAARLEAMLRRQAAEVRHGGTPAEIRLHGLAQYVMAAVADEVFVLELPWRGRDAWLRNLLEQRLFRSANAGTRFFELADQLLRTRSSNPLQADAATVFLLALQLGFRGQYRGAENDAVLRVYRDRLYAYAGGKRGDAQARPAFEQAYQHRLAGEKDERLAPLRRWVTGAKIALGAYVVLSTLVWLAALRPLERAFA